MTKRRNFVIGKYFHTYSRGVNKDKIFLDNQDYLFFMKLIESCNCKETKRELRRNNEGRTKLVQIFCYTLMPNHFHVLMKELVDGGISKFIQKVLSQYTTYFNMKYVRKGVLFESRFKDKLVITDLYFNHLVRYIWNNPVKIINPSYKSIDLLNGKIKLTKQEKEFVKNYPYKYFPKDLNVSSELT